MSLSRQPKFGPGIDRNIPESTRMKLSTTPEAKGRVEGNRNNTRAQVRRLAAHRQTE